MATRVANGGIMNATGTQDLELHLSAWAEGDRLRRDVASTVLALAGAGRMIAGLLGQGALAGRLDYATDRCGIREQQSSLDLMANRIFQDAIRQSPVAAYISEELAVPLPIRAGAPLLVAVDPIDGAPEAAAGMGSSSTFAILPARAAAAGSAADPADFVQPISSQLAAGTIIHGAFTALAVTVGCGTHIFTLDRASDQFLLTAPDVQIPAETDAFAIDISNSRHWPSAIRTYIEDCQRGRDGPRAKDFTMRWSGSFAAEVFRILQRGGIAISPGDHRVSSRIGELAQLYQIAPLTFLIAQAGGAAVCGADDCRNMIPTGLHDTAAFAAGARDEINRLVRLHLDPDAPGERSQLFGHRGLFWS